MGKKSKKAKKLVDSFEGVVASYTRSIDPKYGIHVVKQQQKLQTSQAVANTGSAVVLKAFSDVTDADISDAIAGAATVNLYSQSCGVAVGSIKMRDPNKKAISRTDINEFFDDADDFAATRGSRLKSLEARLAELEAENAALKNGGTP